MTVDLVAPATELVLVNKSRTLELDLTKLQGLWTEQQYLKLTDQTNYLLELTDGEIEVLAMPTDRHQAISLFLLLAFLGYVQRIGGIIRYSPLRLRIRPGVFREPDLLLLCDANDPRRQNQYWHGADLVLEVVSPDDPDRDLVTKRADYAQAAIPEYWIVNPLDETITVLTLTENSYVAHGIFGRSSQASSPLLEGMSVDVNSVFDAQ